MGLLPHFLLSNLQSQAVSWNYPLQIWSAPCPCLEMATSIFALILVPLSKQDGKDPGYDYLYY